MGQHTPQAMNLPRRAAAEVIGTAFLLAAIVGSGIMGERLAGGNEAIALLANSLATGAALIAILLTAGPVAGAHLNPLVSVALALRGDLSWTEASVYATAQVTGAIAGVMAAQLMFGLPLIEMSQKVRPGSPMVFAEAVATFGLLVIVLEGSRSRPESLPFAIAAYITAAYWFTSSTSFANPAVTLARSLSDTFAGISPVNVPGFVLGQLLGGAAAVALGVVVRRPKAPAL